MSSGRPLRLDLARRRPEMSSSSSVRNGHQHFGAILENWDLGRAAEDIDRWKEDRWRTTAEMNLVVIDVGKFGVQPEPTGRYATQGFGVMVYRGPISIIPVPLCLKGASVFWRASQLYFLCSASDVLSVSNRRSSRSARFRSGRQLPQQRHKQQANKQRNKQTNKQIDRPTQDLV